MSSRRNNKAKTNDEFDSTIKLTESEPLSSEPFVPLTIKGTDAPSIPAPPKAKSASPSVKHSSFVRAVEHSPQRLQRTVEPSIKRRSISTPHGANVDHIKPKPPTNDDMDYLDPADRSESKSTSSEPSLRVVLETRSDDGDGSSNDLFGSKAFSKQGSSNDDIDLAGLPLLAGAGIISLDELVPDLETFSENFPKIPERLIFDAERSKTRKMDNHFSGQRGLPSQPPMSMQNRNIGYSAPMFLPSDSRSVLNGNGNDRNMSRNAWGALNGYSESFEDSRNAYRKAGIRGLSLPRVDSMPRQSPSMPTAPISSTWQRFPRNDRNEVADNMNEGKSLKDALDAFEWMLNPVKPPIVGNGNSSFNQNTIGNRPPQAPWASPYLSNQFSTPGSRSPYNSSPSNSGPMGSASRFGMPNRTYHGAQGQMSNASNRMGSNARSNTPSNYGSSSNNSAQRSSSGQTYQSKPLLDSSQIENSTIFDQPPIPIDVGMKVAEQSHKKIKLIIMVAIAALVVLGIFLALRLFAPNDNDSASEGIDASVEQSSSSAISSSASNASTGGGTVVYQYSAVTASGKKYEVQETATFNEAGYCEFTTMKMKFPDAATAKEFTDSLSRDYGSRLTIDSLDGSDATVTINLASQELDREKYENSLRYSVDDLVVLKK